MEILNNLNKKFIDILSYIPWMILKISLSLLYLYLINKDLFYKILLLLENYKFETIIILLGLLYFLDLIFSFLASPFKIKRLSLNENEVQNLIKSNKELRKIYNNQNKDNTNFTSSLLDISNHIWYIIPMFFENKILLFKSLRNTLIVFFWLNLLFVIYTIVYFNKINFIFWIVANPIYLLFIFILTKEIEEYYLWFISSILNINFYLKNYNWKK